MPENDSLLDAIGSAGVENPAKKLKYDHTGTALTPEEEEKMQKFLREARSKSVLGTEKNWSDYTPDTEGATNIGGGWVPIDRTSLGVRDIFYPESWEIRIKPADVKSIKNWSSVDDDNAPVTNEVFNEIIKACCTITGPNGEKIGWGKLTSWDRFWLLLKISEYTFQKPNAELQYDEECPECGRTVKFSITSNNLVYEFPDEELVDKHYDREGRKWVINPKEYDIDAPFVTLYVPTLEKDAEILKWAYRQAQQKKTYQEAFIRFLPWLLPKVTKDQQAMDNMILKCKREFDDWDVDLFAFMEDVRKNIDVQQTEHLKQICTCGEEVQTAVRFPNGIKHIFAVPHKHKKFGSK